MSWLSSLLPAIGGAVGTIVGGPGAGLVGSLAGQGAAQDLGGSSAGAAGVGGISGPSQSLALADSLLGAQQYATAQSLRNQALQSAVQGYNQRAPLRAQGIAMTTQAADPDLDSIFQSSNPFARGIGGGSATPYNAAPYQASASGIQSAPTQPQTEFTGLPQAQQMLGKFGQDLSSALPANGPLKISPIPGAPDMYSLGINPANFPSAQGVKPAGVAPGIPQLTPPTSSPGAYG
jgi:hypothetical protein